MSASVKRSIQWRPQIAASAEATLLSLRGLRKAYGDELLFESLDLELAAKHTLVILGRSGCGKSTLLRMLAGLEAVDAGEIRLRDLAINSLPPQQRGIVYLGQEALLFDHLNVFENIAFGLRLRRLTQHEINQRVDAMLSHLGLQTHRHKQVEQLSGGQKQRVAFGRALAVRPEILLLDEPFSSLDADIRADMQQLFRSMAAQFAITALFVTHDAEEALRIGDRFAHLHDGTLTVYADRAEFINDPATGVCRKIDFWQHLQD